MKPGDLVYPWAHNGDYTVALYLGREFKDWKYVPYGVCFWGGQCYTIEIEQLAKVEDAKG